MQTAPTSPSARSNTASAVIAGQSSQANPAAAAGMAAASVSAPSTPRNAGPGIQAQQGAAWWRTMITPQFFTGGTTAAMRYQDRQPGSSAQLAPTAKKARQETVLPGTSPEPAPVSPPINTLDPLLRTPLHLAIRAGNVGKVAELLQVPHVELNIPALHNRRTPLNEAVTQGNHEIVALLIEASQGRHRTQTRLNGLTGRTERHIDAANYDGQIRLDPDISDCDGMTPLHHAVTRGDPRLVKLLLQIEGIDRNPSSPEGIRPLHIAAYAGNAELVRLLLDGHPESLDVNATTSSNMTALWAAAHRGQQEAVAELLQVPGIDTSATPHGGLNARETARRQGHAMVASILELHDVLNPRSVS